MASINTETKTGENTELENLRPSQSNSKACIQLLDQWLADESGYDEESWPKIKTMLEQNRTSNRPLFNE